MHAREVRIWNQIVQVELRLMLIRIKKCRMKWKEINPEVCDGCTKINFTRNNSKGSSTVQWAFGWFKHFFVFTAFCSYSFIEVHNFQGWSTKNYLKIRNSRFHHQFSVNLWTVVVNRMRIRIYLRVSRNIKCRRIPTVFREWSKTRIVSLEINAEYVASIKHLAQ